MNTRKSLAKVFGPVLLLTATLALPIDTAQAKEHGRAAAHAQADQHQKQKKNKQKVQQQQRQQVVRQSRSQRAKVQQHVKAQQKVKAQKVKVQQRQQALQRQAALDRQAALQRQQSLQRQRALQAQALSRQQALTRQQALERQRALDRQRALTLQRQRQNRAYRYDDRYYAAPPVRRGRGGADPNVFHVDGYLEDGGDCLFLHDHEGRTWAMVGNAYGLQPGEHVRLYGRPVDAGNACGYRAAAFDIYEVKTVWADKNHKRTYYDNLYDGPFDQNRAYEDDRYYNGQYDTYEDRQERESWWDRIFGG